MISLLPATARGPCGGRARWLSTGLLACAVVLGPAGSALASHSAMSDGTMCPHAAGSSSPAAPGQQPPPARTGSEAPLAAAGPAAKAASSTPATRPASRPASQVQARQPASAVSQPASARAGARSTASANAVASAPQRAAVAVPTSRQAQAPRTAHRSPGSSERAVHVRSAPASVKRLAPPAARPLPRHVAPVEPVVAADRPLIPTPLVAGLALLGLAGLALAGMLLRRRASAGTAIGGESRGPVAPARAEALVEAELQEMIAEARARELLAPEAKEEDRQDLVGSR